jgi:hypothetical protein
MSGKPQRKPNEQEPHVPNQPSPGTEDPEHDPDSDPPRSAAPPDGPSARDGGRQEE